MDVGSDGGLLHLLVVGRDAAVADVVLDGVIEEHRVLGDHADVGSKRRLLHLRGDREDGAIIILVRGLVVNTHSNITKCYYMLEEAT